MHKRIRLLIGIEIDQNLKWLRKFWNEIKPGGEDDFERIFELASGVTLINMRQTVIPKFTDTFWVSQLPQLPVALNENEIRRASKIYEIFSRLDSVYSHLLSIDFGYGPHSLENEGIRYFGMFGLIVKEALEFEYPFN